MNDDKIIIQLFFERSQEAITMLSQKYGKMCRWIIGNILKDKQDVEECENDVYLKVWGSVPPTYPECLPAFISKVSRNVALTRYRYNNREKRNLYFQIYFSEIEECIPTIDNVEDATDETIITAINLFLMKQDKLTRTIFTQRYFYMDSITNISLKVGLSETNVSTKLYRTRLKLKEYLLKEEICL